VPDPSLLEALRIQRIGFESKTLSSPLYAALAEVVLADVERDGPCAAVFAEAPADIHVLDDALVLRFFGALHRLVLDGGAPELARWFPTAGGRFDGGDPGPDLLATVEANHAVLAEGLHRGVQTNEVGRSASLAVGYLALLRRFGLPLRLLEIGTSAGLNLRWDRWRYESAASAWGDPGARLRFADDVYRAPLPELSAPLGPDAAVAERRGCDRSPIDPSTEEGRLLLRSFVWPDQHERLQRLDAALAVAAEVPAQVDAADAGEWTATRLAEPAGGVVSVVAHSIVWQYLPAASQQRVLDALASAGAVATPDAPVAWLRMEPPSELGKPALLRLTTWSGGDGEERLLAHCGYHGRPVRAEISEGLGSSVPPLG
jgi:hypothetical protein